MFCIFTHDMKPIRDTNSEPGLPVGKLALFMRFGTFFMTKVEQDDMKCLF